jgi:hypothetical protein
MSECERCGGTGWEYCSASTYCTDDSHGGYCSCPAGIERRQEEEEESK